MQQQVSVQDCVLIIGKQQVRIEMLETHLAQANARIKELTPKPTDTPDKVKP